MTETKKDFVRMYVSLNKALFEVMGDEAAAKILERADQIFKTLENPLSGTIWEGK